jgi:hypothetical protein
MKRLHVHVSVSDLTESIRFYSTLFKAEPVVLKDDYAKWVIEEPRVNFAISMRGEARGVDHLGIQVESPDELREIAGRLGEAEHRVIEQKNSACCYARSDKAWATDPQGIAWETFLTFGETTIYGEGVSVRPTPGGHSAPDVTNGRAAAAACCAKADA